LSTMATTRNRSGSIEASSIFSDQNWEPDESYSCFPNAVGVVTPNFWLLRAPRHSAIDRRSLNLSILQQMVSYISITDTVTKRASFIQFLANCTEHCAI